MVSRCCGGLRCSIPAPTILGVRTWTVTPHRREAGDAYVCEADCRFAPRSRAVTPPLALRCIPQRIRGHGSENRITDSTDVQTTQANIELPSVSFSMFRAPSKRPTCARIVHSSGAHTAGSNAWALCAGARSWTCSPAASTGSASGSVARTATLTASGSDVPGLQLESALNAKADPSIAQPARTRRRLERMHVAFAYAVPGVFTSNS